jgi:hypothetical protein
VAFVTVLATATVTIPAVTISGQLVAELVTADAEVPVAAVQGSGVIFAGTARAFARAQPIVAAAHYGRPYNPEQRAYLVNPIDDVETVVEMSNDLGQTENGFFIKIEAEVMKVTGGAGTTTLTVERGQFSSVAVAHGAGV